MSPGIIDLGKSEWDRNEGLSPIVWQQAIWNLESGIWNQNIHARPRRGESFPSSAN